MTTVVLWSLAGCVNTAVVRTGKVVPPGEARMVYATGYQYAPEALVEYDVRVTESRRTPGGTTTSQETMPWAHAAQAMAGAHFGLPYGFELGAAISAPFFFGGALFARKSIVDTEHFAMALAGDVSGGWFGADSVGLGGSVSMWTARARLDASVHWDGLALYASPSLVEYGAKSTRTDDASGESVSGSDSATLVGGTWGVRLGRAWGIYAEVGTLFSLEKQGGVLITPAIGLELDIADDED